ncbi:pentatricopeptide repeat-containing protein At1g60770 [Ricinus communis]|uniref:Pentatricopeptide repeat-containing protein, putative n=1 Tax=Ricinus communis TaxID=3988 RepID=B9SPI6_RICCO|nr:pentatricopeptide repeat-containing protein At1g60770 [Ricinus communis]EEF34462.1 pentatricopeptide repeat-containing protein, putative [Ricinus communis]|eukprot:XP_002527905.1 pentatricopeptide repeat-containing protein At1g60770 [Ricinus communis]
MAMPQLFGRTKNVAKRSKKYLEEALYFRLFKEGSSEVKVREQLNQFLKSSKRVYKWEVGDTLKKLRSRGLYYPALKLSEAMSKRGMNKTVSDQAIHLDLVAKTRGIPAAEIFFIDLPETSKNHLTYGALLNCYCNQLMTEEAEALMEKMKELNLGLSSMSYNSLMTLYTKIGQPERIPGIIQEMKSDSIMPDSYTYNVWMRALAAVNDISGAERVIEEMKRDGRVAADWTTYSNLASIYVDAQLFEKAEKTLKELEKRNVHRDHSAFQFLITLYGRIGNLHELYRIWRSLRLAFPKTSNISYLNMIQVLVNLKDLPGAEKCFREWESNCSGYDIRVANVLIKAYAKKGLLEKAEELKERAIGRGAKPNAKTWEIFSDYYFENGDIKLSVECLANAISKGRGDGQKWIPSPEVVASFMAHFEQQKDVDGAEGFIEILKKATDDVEANVFESLIRTYAAAGRTSQVLRRRLKMENVEVSEAGQKLLEMICVE